CLLSLISLFFLLLFVFPGVVTVTVSQGSDAILPCSPTPKENLSFKSFKWRKDGQNVFYYDAGNHYNNGLRGQDPQFKDRVSFFQDQLRSGNASIQIQNVTIQDSGIYSCEISGLNSGSQTFNIKLVVNVPTLQTREGSDVMLPCSPSGKNDLTYQVFDWEKDDEQQVFLYHNGKHYNNGLTGQNENFKNRVEFFQDQLQFGNASIRIKNTKLTDSGNYSCTFPLLQPPGQKFYMNLVVQCINLKDRTQDRSDVCRKPIITIKKTADGIRVICSVPGVSKVKMEMELHNSDDGTVYKPVDAGTSQNPQYFIFSVTEEDHYRCLVKQEEFCHQLYSEESFVLISDVCLKPTLSTKKTADGIRVICSVPDVSKVKMEMELHNSDNKSVGQLVDNGISQNRQYFIFSVTEEDHYRCLVKQEEFCHQLYSEESFVLISGDDKGLSPGYVAVIVIVIVAFILSAILNITLLYFRWKRKRSSGDRTDIANSEGELHHLKVQKNSELTNET
ncbi:PREDICTED: uncharacterized protein LOC106909985, partial [Poecilia mexicana]|uniref:uncharacterized protein LOC106909985 n=1 Tax=Poecilia mexicana TaxID=48701 RepID=UPI00072E964A